MAQVGNIHFDITADMRQIDGQLTILENSFQSTFAKITRQAQTVSRTVGGALGVLGAAGAAVGVGLLALATQAASYADEIGRAAQGTGTTTEFLSAMRYGVEVTGGSFANLTNGIEAFNKKIVAAAQGSNAALRDFALLDVNIRNSNGTLKTNEQLLLEVAESLSKLPPGAQQSAAATKLLVLLCH